MSDEMEFDTYSFYYTSAEGRESDFTFHPEWDATWTNVLENFLDFLSSIYGYDIRDQVAVKFKAHRSKEDWSGPTFGDVIRTDSDFKFGGTD